MKNPFTKIIEKRPWLQFLGNKYVLILIFFSIWMIFLDNYSLLDHRILNKQIEELEDNKKYYQQEIRNDMRKIKFLKNSYQIEKYAREKYYMKRENEDIFIIEFEKDSIKKNDEL